MNPKFCRFYLTKGDFEHTDPLPKVRGPAVPDWRENAQNTVSPYWMPGTPSVASLEFWVIVIGEDDFILQF